MTPNEVIPVLEAVHKLKEHDLEVSLYGGTLLGYHRGDGVIPWDNDIDLVALAPDFGEHHLRYLLGEGFELHHIDPIEPWMAYHLTTNEKLGPLPETGNIKLRHGDTKIGIHLLHLGHDNNWFHTAYPGELIRIPHEYGYDLQEGVFLGVPVTLTAHPGKLLAHIYGPHWRKPDPDYIGSDRHTTQRETIQVGPAKTVYTGGVFDCLHRGHLNILRTAAALGDKLIVGVQTDLAVQATKHAPPVHDLPTRISNIEKLGLAADVIPYRSGLDGIILDEVYPDLFVHGDDWETQADRTHVRGVLERMASRIILIPYTPGISSTTLKQNGDCP